MPAKVVFYKTKPYCKVTFRLEKEMALGARQAAVAGEFNEWEITRTPMRLLRNGAFTASVNLPKGREYQYRFVLDGERWVTDDGADKQVYCDYADGENAVVVV